MNPKRRVTAALLPAAAVLLVTALSAGAATGAPDAALPAGPNPACPDENAAAEQAALRFQDVADDSTHAANIGCIAYYEITLGAGNGGLFAPYRKVTRWQMAFFMTRAAARAGIEEVDDPPGQGFDDIAGKSAAARNAINTAAFLGLMPGTTATTFSPDQQVTRSDMALFLLRLLELTTVDSPVRVAVEPINGAVTITRGGRPVPIDDSFADVIDVVTAAEQWAINAIYELGVAGGRADGSYDPYGAVTRGQMASFIIRALGHTGLQPDGPITLDPPAEDPPAEEPPAPEAAPPPEPPAEPPPPAAGRPLPPDPGGVYTGDPLQLIAHARFGRSYSLPGSGGDRWEVWICNTPAGSGSGPADYAAQFTGRVAPWFDWASGGQYRPVFAAGGAVSVGPSLDYYQSCRYAVYDRYRGDQTEADGALIIVFDPLDDSGLLGMGGFGCGPISDQGFPGNGRAVLINASAVADSTVLTHEIGHALCWPHSYSGETYRRGRIWEYDNPMDIMGWSDGAGAESLPTLGTSAVNRYAAGWIPPSRIAVHNPGTTSRYTLAPIGGQGTQMLVVLLEEGDRLRYWALGARTRGGGDMDWADRGIPEEGVEINRIDQSLFGCYRPYFGYCSGLERRTTPLFDEDDGYDPGRAVHVMNEPGEGWTYGGEEGLSVSLVSRSGDDFVVEVRSNREPDPSPPPPPESEPEPDPESPPPPEPETPPDTVMLTDVAAGLGFTCGVRPGGAVTCWGNDEHGRLEAPAGEFTAVAAGSRHACAIRPGGAVECWGGNEDGEADAPSGNFTAVTAGISHTCGVRPGNEVFCWGDGGQGQTEAPDGEFVSVAAGGYHTCGVRSDRTVFCWGDGGQGQTEAPDGEFVSVAAGGYHTCGIRSDRTVVCWGRGFEGQADGPGGEFVSVAAGGYHTCGIRSGRTVVCWGNDEDGADEAISGEFTVIAAGWKHTCGIRPDRSVECWGDNEYGASEAPTRFTAVAAGDFHSCGLRLTGAVTCWGGNEDGQSDAPAGAFTQVSAGWRHTCGVRPDRTAVCWGYNSNGQADAPSGGFTAVTAAVAHSCGVTSYSWVVCWGKNDSGESRPPFAFGFGAVAAGGEHTCGIRLTFDIECWGGGDSGESTPPAGVFMDVSAGDYHSCGVRRASGRVVCWGGNDYGQLNAPAGRFTKITSGQSHTCGLRLGGAVVCWGDNDYGQLNAPTGRFTDVSAGSFHACGLRSDGAVVCWGDNYYGQLDAPSWRRGG